MKNRKETDSIIGRAMAGHAAREALARGGNPKLAENAKDYENPLTDMVNLMIAHEKARQSIKEAKAKRDEVRRYLLQLQADEAEALSETHLRMAATGGGLFLADSRSQSQESGINWSDVLEYVTRDGGKTQPWLVDGGRLVRKGEEEPDAKARQGYIPSPTTRTCQNCAHLQSETVPVKTGWGEELETQRLLRCGLGGFPVWSTATCNEWGEKV